MILWIQNLWICLLSIWRSKKYFPNLWELKNFTDIIIRDSYNSCYWGFVKVDVTQIANYKKLLEQDLIETYQLDGNKQKIFFRSTKSGQFLYEEHEKRHNLWLKRDNAFIKQFDQKTVEQVEKFMRAFNDYLETQIVELGGNADENWYYIKNYT